MNDTHRGIALLLKSAVTGQPQTLPEGFRLEEAAPVLKRQSLIPLAFQGAVNCGITQPKELLEQYRAVSCRNLLASEHQRLALERLFDCFDREKIPFLPLKGCEMKALYPQPELRVMGDADILIREEDHGRIAPLMEQMGFSYVTENAHVFEWHSPRLHVELHKCLAPPSDRDYHAYYGTGWHLAKPGQGSRWCLTAEDAFVFLFVHFARHYRVSGIGCRHVVDLYVYLRSHPGLDEAYIAGELKALRLLEFYGNIRNLLRVWFENAPSGEITELITAYIFSGGNWGSEARAILLQEVRRVSTGANVSGTRGRALVSALFPPLEDMRYRYACLLRRPWLLPLCWVARWLELVFRRPGAIGRKMKNLAGVTGDSVAMQQQALRKVGLDFAGD